MNEPEKLKTKSSPPEAETLGVVPHWTEQRHPAYRQGMLASPQVNRIDVLRPVREVLQEIASCRTIAASSLHGLVVADALGIPNVWVRAYPAQVADAEMPAFKYQDYYSVFGIFPKRPVPLTGSLRMDQLEPYFTTWQRPGLAEIRDRLLAAFPFAKSRARNGGNIEW